MIATLPNCVVDEDDVAQTFRPVDPSSGLGFVPDASSGSQREDHVNGVRRESFFEPNRTNGHNGDAARTNGSQSAGPEVGRSRLACDPARAAALGASPAESATCRQSAKSDRELIEALVHSKIFADYERAFSEATGLPVALRPVETWQLVHHGKRHESPFCALMAGAGRSCGVCLQVHERLSQGATCQPHTVVCHAGLSETAVPVRLGDRLIGFLRTGQVFCKRPTERQFQRTLKFLAKSNVDVDRDGLREAYFGTRVVSGKQHQSVVGLLQIFAQHLSLVGNQILIQRDNAESPRIAKAKAFIREHHAEDLRVADVAAFVNTSPFYFCKRFKQATGMTFTNFLSRVRVERSKNLLVNPNLRVGEIAYEVGFQSLTHFNRVFQRVLGQSASRYRSQLLGGRK